METSKLLQLKKLTPPLNPPCLISQLIVHHHVAEIKDRDLISSASPIPPSNAKFVGTHRLNGLNCFDQEYSTSTSDLVASHHFSGQAPQSLGFSRAIACIVCMLSPIQHNILSCYCPNLLHLSILHQCLLSNFFRCKGSIDGYQAAKYSRTLPMPR